MNSDEEIIPIKSLRKLDYIFLHNIEIRENQLLQNEILKWAKELVTDCRQEWSEIYATTIDAIIACDRKNEAIKRGKSRDKKYAPFRAHFKECQFKKFLEYKELGKTLTAPTFVSWYLKNKADNINIPYVKSNLYHKLIQLAQENNQEFKKL